MILFILLIRLPHRLVKRDPVYIGEIKIFTGFPSKVHKLFASWSMERALEFNREIINALKSVNSVKYLH